MEYHIRITPADPEKGDPRFIRIAVDDPREAFWLGVYWARYLPQLDTVVSAESMANHLEHSDEHQRIEAITPPKFASMLSNYLLAVEAAEKAERKEHPPCE